MGEIGEGPSRNMSKGHMDKPKGVGSRVGGREGWGGMVGGKVKTTVLEQQ